MSLIHVDRLIGERAAGQDSLITSSQLRELGLGRGAIEHRVKRGLLHRMHEGVYCWGIPSDSPWAAARAAVFACGEGTVVTHHAATGLYGLRSHFSGPIDVTVVVGLRGRRAVATERVVLEFDSYEFHATRAAFERHRRPNSGAHARTPCRAEDNLARAHARIARARRSDG